MRCWFDFLPVAPAIFGAFLAGCGDAPLDVGRVCDVDDTCQTGLACVDPADTFVASNDAGCTGVTTKGTTICTKACSGDEDCAPFGDHVVCAENGCGDAGICLPAGGASVRPSH